MNKMKLDEFNLLKKSLIESRHIEQIEVGKCVQADTIFVKNGVYALSSKKIEIIVTPPNIQ